MTTPATQVLTEAIDRMADALNAHDGDIDYSADLTKPWFALVEAARPFTAGEAEASASAGALTAATAPVIDDFYPDASFEMRRGWEAAVRAFLAAQPAADAEPYTKEPSHGE